MSQCKVVRSTKRKTYHTIRGGNGNDWSIQLEITPLKTKIKKRKRVYRGTIGNSPYIYIQDYTYKIRGRYSDKFIRKYGSGSTNRNWGQISCKESEHRRYIVAISALIQEDVERMVKNNDGNVITRDKAYIQEKYLFGF